MIRSIIAWLNKRFPEVLTVTKADYTQLREEVAGYNVMYQNMTQMEQKLAGIERRLQTLENVQGFVNSGKGSFKLER